MKHRTRLFINQLEGRIVPATSIVNVPSFEEREKWLLADALEQAGGNQSEAARILRISRDRMRYKMAKYNLS